jgi:hypothetical protein
MGSDAQVDDTIRVAAGTARGLPAARLAASNPYALGQLVQYEARELVSPTHPTAPVTPTSQIQFRTGIIG